jgi:[DsrC]-trisulfide reductase subunit J
VAHGRLSALILAALFIAAVSLGFALAARSAERTPMPVIPKGKGSYCVRPVDFMRRYHMTMLLQQREVMVHEGVRTDFNIEGCVNCHAVKGADGQPVGYDDPKHFCRACHDYESVSIDCFECHASKPAPPVKAAEVQPAVDPRDLAALNDYLHEARR